MIRSIVFAIRGMRRAQKDALTEAGESELVSALQEGRFVLVVTGAGISVASGIPTFRAKDGGCIAAAESQYRELGLNERPAFG